MKLRIAKELALPLDAVTQTIAILARKRSGKSYTARRIAEQMFAAELQIVCIDPKGDWWGMRSSADGRGPGLSIVILGGDHGDVPLEVSSGEMVAKLVVEERVSVLLDLSLFRKHEVATFVTAFAEALYRLKAREIYRTPLMLLIDEADAVAPQKPQGGEERMLGAIEDIVRRGGQRGIGCTVVTQRSAVLNKNVLTQAQVMIAMRTIAPQDLKAMDAWIEVHGTPTQRATLMESLPSLPRGDAWIWSPGWPDDDGIFQRVHVERIETFDSGATPKPGERRIEPKKRADVDLEALRRQMAETVERAKANDPTALRRRITELEGMLGKANAAVMGAAVKLERVVEKRVEVPVLKDAQLKRLDLSTYQVMCDVEKWRAAVNEIIAAVQKIRRDVPAPRPFPPATSSFPRKKEDTEDNGSAQLGAGERRVLTAIAQHQEGVTKEQLTVLTGYKRSTRDLYLQRLGQRSLIARGGDRICATETGAAELGPDFEPLPTGTALLEHWRRKLPAGELAVLEFAVAAWPESVGKDQISEATSYQRSTRDLYVQRLKSRRLLDEASRGRVRASSHLMEAT